MAGGAVQLGSATQLNDTQVRVTQFNGGSGSAWALANANQFDTAGGAFLPAAPQSGTLA